MIYSVIMIRTQISLEADLYEHAKKEARRRGISFAELVRRSLAQTLGPRDGERSWMRYAGTVETGDSRSSATIDEVVYGKARS